jgi:G3E family GTPase
LTFIDQILQHDQTVSSVGIEVKDKSLSLEKLNTWLRGLLRDKGTDIFRSKGVLNVTGQDKAFVFQGVHMLLDAKPGQDWGTTARTNKVRSKITFPADQIFLTITCCRSSSLVAT